MRDKQLESTLEKIISNMDIPWNRKKDLNPAKLRWLQKNMGERNKNNPHYNEAMDAIQKLIDNG